MIEFNPSIPADFGVWQSDFSTDNWFGMSLGVIAATATRMGYKLVAATILNAVLLRSELVPKLEAGFPVMWGPSLGWCGGCPAQPRSRHSPLPPHITPPHHT